MNTLPAGLYGIADAAFGDPVALGENLANAGCRTVQLRAKNWEPERLIPAAQALQHILSRLGCCFILNDHPEIAAQVRADGVHIGQTDGSVAQARSLLGPNTLIGLSTHSLEQAQTPHGADYIGFGPIFSTTTKVHAEPSKGTSLLSEVVRLSTVPVVAIGGIDSSNISDVRATGPHGWAVISALLQAPDLNIAVKAMR